MVNNFFIEKKFKFSINLFCFLRASLLVQWFYKGMLIKSLYKMNLSKRKMALKGIRGAVDSSVVDGALSLFGEQLRDRCGSLLMRSATFFPKQNRRRF